MKHICFLFLMLLLFACEKSGTNEATLFQAAPTIGEGGVDFATLKSFILTPKCIRCHGWVADEGQVQSRITAGNPETSTLYIRLVNGSMPQGGPALTSSELAVVASYINGPAGNTPAPQIPLTPTYGSLKVHLFEKSCTSCHNTSGRDPDLSQLTEIRHEIDEIQDQLDFGTMPPLDNEGNPRAPVPTQEVLDTFREWVLNGMPNN